MEISPDKSEAIAVLGQDPIRYKIIKDNRYLQQAKNLNISVVKLVVKMKKKFNKN
jgi:hypothetical protein